MTGVTQKAEPVLGAPHIIYSITYIHTYTNTYIYKIKTHDESRGQEEAAVRDERVSYLQVAPLKNSQTL